MPRVNTVKDSEMHQLAEYFGVNYRKDFFEFVKNKVQFIRNCTFLYFSL